MLSGWPSQADPSNRLANFDGRSTHMEVVPLALELGRGVDLVGHDASDGLQGHVSELRMFHLEERRNCSHVTLIVFGNSDRRQLHPISFCSCSNFAFLLTDFNIFRFKIFRSAVRIFLFFQQGKSRNACSMGEKNYLLDILHPLSHLLVAHVVDILDEGVVLLPEGHPKAATLRGWNNGMSTRKMVFVHDTWVDESSA